MSSAGRSRRFRILHRLDQARHDRDACLPHAPARLGLVAHRGDGRGRRPHERQAGVRDGLGEVGALGQEAVAGMDGVRPGGAGRFQDAIHAEVALRRRRRTDEPRGIRLENVGGEPVRLRVHGHRADAELTRRANDTDGDLAAVRDQEGADQDRRPEKRWGTGPFEPRNLRTRRRGGKPREVPAPNGKGAGPEAGPAPGRPSIGGLPNALGLPDVSGTGDLARSSRARGA